MATYAVMNGDIVENVIVADLQNTAEQVTGRECIKYTESNPAGIGDIYDRKTRTFIAPKVETK